MTKYIKPSLLATLVFASFWTSAQVNPLDFVMDSSYQRFKATVLGNGVVLGSSDMSAGSLGRTTVTAASDGSLVVKTPTSVPLSPSVPVEVTSKVDKLAVAKAVAKGAFKVAAGAIGIVGAGKALVDVAREVNAIYKANSDGSAGYVDDSPDVKCDSSKTMSPTNAIASCKANYTTFSTFAYEPSGTICYVRAVCANGQTLSYGTVPMRTSTQEVPLTQQQLEDRIAQKSGWPTSSQLGEALKEAVKAGEIVEAKPQSITGPATKQVSKVTTNNPDGTKTTSTTTNNYTYEGAKVNVNTSNATQVTNASGTVISNTSSVTEAAPAAEAPPTEKIEVCGLPTTPPCKIDETGTKTDKGTTYDTAKTAIDATETARKTAIDGAQQIARPEWSFTFQLPTGCVAFNTGLKGVVLDVCRWRDVMHDLLSMVWAGATAFCLIGMVGRTIRES